MTIAMTPMGIPAGTDVSWRALDGGLWVARRDGRHLGSVQPGRRWLAFDADDEPIGGFRSLGEAKTAVAHPAGEDGSARSRGAAADRRRPVLPGVALGSNRRGQAWSRVAPAAVLGVASVLSVAGWTWTALPH